MRKFIFSAVGLLGLAACSGSDPDAGSGGSGGGGGGGSTSPSGIVVPAVLAGDVGSVSYDSSTGTLRMSIDGFDSPFSVQTLTADPGLDIATTDGTTSYDAYFYQTTGDNRYYLALVAEGAHTMVAAVATEPEHGTFFGGTSYDRLNPVQIPLSGSAIYRSTYAGVYSLQDPNGSDRASRTTGDGVLSVNLTEGKVEGSVFNRIIVEDGSALADVALIKTNLNGAEYLGQIMLGNQAVGEYGGLLAGIENMPANYPGANTGALPAEAATVLVFKPISGSPLLEYGMFLAPVCGGASASSNCSP